MTLSPEHRTIGGIAINEPRRVAIRLSFWYQREGRRIVKERFDKHWSSFRDSNRPPRLTVRPMEKRWGSLSAIGRSLIINQRLVEADIDAIDFVLVHELCHLRHHDHGEAFYALLTTHAGSANPQRPLGAMDGVIACALVAAVAFLFSCRQVRRNG